jgi:hypothetical protein
MRHTQTDQSPSRAGTPAEHFDAWLDDFASAELDDTLDRQLFAIRESLADFRSL